LAVFSFGETEFGHWLLASERVRLRGVLRLRRRSDSNEATYDGLPGTSLMLADPVPDPIYYLLGRKDRAYRKGRVTREIQQYKQHLLTLSRKELDELVLQEQKREHELQEQRLSFNLPEDQADFVHWSRMATWTVDESVALSLGKEPGRVNWERVRLRRHHCPFAKRYEKLRDIAQRAVLADQLQKLVSPESYILWASRNGIELASGLLEAVEAHGQFVLDRQTLEEQLLNLHEEHTKTLEAMASLKDALADERMAFQLFREEMAGAATGREAVENRPLATRERESLDSILLVGAIRGYGFDPEKRNSASSRIAEDLALLGLELSDDTVRTHLKRAAEPLRPDWLVRLGSSPTPPRANRKRRNT
jgi:hypothetical protein